MKSKFWFLTKDSLKKKINTKSFKIVNILLFIAILVLLNLDSLIKKFGGDFDDSIKIYVIDEVNVYDEMEELFKSGYFDALESYNAKLEKSDKSVEELKNIILEENSKDIVVNIKYDYENVFDVDFISYEYVDQLLYQSITNALNVVKVNEAIKRSNISEEVLAKIYETVKINRILLNENLDENKELVEKIGGVVSLLFVMPFFILIVLIVQMIGAEINEEKRTKAMEVIISSVPAKIHFLSKLVAANVFSIMQGAMLILYVIFGFIVRVFISGVPSSATVAGVSASSLSDYIQVFFESDVASRIVMGIPFFVVLIILSFFAYSLFIGVLASVTTNMEDYQQIQTPVMVFLMIGYYLAIYASVYQGASFIKVAAFVPFISGILAPVLYSLGQFTLLELTISIVLLGITCYFLYKYGLKIYKDGILNYQSSNLWKKMFNSLKS